MSDLINIKGIGNKSLSLLNTMNIKNIYDLVTYFPYRYNFIKLTELENIKNGEPLVIEGIVESSPILRRFGKMNSLSFRFNYKNKIFDLIIFNRGFLKDKIKIGTFLTILGKYDEKRNNITVSDLRFKKIDNEEIESVYHLVSGMSLTNIKKYINNALEQIKFINDYVPEELNKKYSFLEKKEAIEKIHNPKNIKDIKQSELKLIYEELFLFMFKINYNKLKLKEEAKKQIIDVDIEEVDDFIRNLPFELTIDQLNATKEIYKDLTGEKRMNRMLQGDVGSGKTIVSIVASYINYLTKRQTALMAPTEVLAIQHYNNISEILKNTNLKVSLITGSTKKKEKEEILEKISEGNIDLIIGTHALISDKVKFKSLGLVITDEQHRFGVNQRSNLRTKGILPDTLYMSATPIPRTYALTIYGDMDISSIKTKPSGRKEIKTIIKQEKEIKEVLSLILKEVKEGHQIYVVSPIIEESENLDITPVVELKKKIDLAFNNKIKTGLLHGKLKSNEKQEIMESFKNGETKILISTTVIEVGVDVANATMMVIFNAERFGLATLHQLRGRIGRGEAESTCILIGNKNNKRLKVLEESNDGFYITEQDFLQRGEGDLFGTKQSGDMSFKIANLKRDYKVLVQAKQDSLEFIEKNVKNDFKNYQNYYKIVKEMEFID